MTEQQTETTTYKLGKYYFMTLKHLPTGIMVEGKGTIKGRLRLDLGKELYKLTRDYRDDMAKELISPNEIIPQLHS